MQKAIYTLSCQQYSLMAVASFGRIICASCTEGLKSFCTPLGSWLLLMMALMFSLIQEGFHEITFLYGLKCQYNCNRIFAWAKKILRIIFKSWSYKA